MVSRKDPYSWTKRKLSRIIFIGFLFPPLPLIASELLRDQHPGEAYVFESNEAEISGTIQEAQAILIGTEWAMRLYNDAFLVTESCEYKITPIRFWLLTFVRIESKEKVYAILLPDGTIIEPRILERS